ncbi:MAG: 2-hydroxychromene-2-carboxylate isomerase [Dongiaceae bacterium]
MSEPETSVSASAGAKSEPIEFHFDFVSPYGCLGGFGIEQVAARHGRSVRWCPMLLGVTVIKIMGQRPVPEIPLKGTYAAHDLQRFFRLVGLPWHPANDSRVDPLPGLRAFVWLDARDPAAGKQLAQRIYRAHWCEGRDMSAPDSVADEAAAIGLDRASVIAAMRDDRIKARLREQVEASITKGVFGCPTFIVDGEMFWGADRLEQVERWIASGGW